MTALPEYQRLEAQAIWRPAPDAQRRDVIVSLGDATLTISDSHDRALAHWSLAAVTRMNPGTRPALYAPDAPPGEDGPADEVLEIEDETMIRAIEKLRSAIERRRPRPGRLRLLLTGGALIAGLALAVFWLPGALVNQTVAMLPDPTRASVGQKLLTRVRRVAGAPCTGTMGRAALGRLTTRVLGSGKAQVMVLSGGTVAATHLPGGIILLHRDLIEGADEPDVAAGFILAEAVRIAQEDPMHALLDEAGLMATLRLLTSGEVPEAVLDSYAEKLLTRAPEPIETGPLIARFALAELRASPYAQELAQLGEPRPELIAQDPVPLAAAQPLITDGDWVALQGICTG